MTEATCLQEGMSWNDSMSDDMKARTNVVQETIDAG
jgi:hypothetical protein